MDQYIATTSKIGETLVTLQKIEMLLKACLILVFNSDAERRFQKILKEDKRTFGMLLKQMKSKVDLPENFESDLNELLHFRNLFIHKLIMQEWFSLYTEKGQHSVNLFTINILKKSAICVRIFVAFGTKMASKSLQENKEMFDKIIERIVQTTPYFNEYPFDKYLEEFLKDIDENFANKILNK